MANTDIKWFSSEDLNAPSLPASWNSLTNVLDACLLSGYGSQGISLISINNGAAIATFNTNHSFKQFQVIEISGSSENILNTEFKILGVSPTTVEFEVDLPDGNYTGVMSGRIAPLGWSKPFSDTGRAVYRAKDIDKNPYYLRVDCTKDASYPDSYAKFAKVGLLESCTDINDLSGNQAPFDSAAPTKNWVMTNGYPGWAKWKYAIGDTASTDSVAQTAGNRKWTIIGNEYCFYILIQASVGTNFETPYGFGAVQTNGLPHPFLLSNLFYDQPANTISATSSLGNTSLNLVSGLFDYAGSLANTAAFRLISGLNIASSGAAANTIKADPILGYYLTPFYFIDPSNYIIGQLPLVASCINNASTEVNGSLYRDIQAVYLLRRFRVTSNNSAILGMLFFNIFEDN